MAVPAWLLLAFLTVVARSVLKTHQKILLNDASESAVIFARDSAAALILVPVSAYILLTSGLATTPRSLWALLATGVLNVVGAFLVMGALRAEDASIVVPIMAFSPVVTAIAEPFIRTTTVPPMAVAGGVLAGVGAAVVAADENTLASLTSSLTSRGVAFALAANVVYGITSNLDGVATAVINPLVVATTVTLFVLVSSTAGLLLQNRRSVDEAAAEVAGVGVGASAVQGVLKVAAYVGVFYGFALAPSSTQISIAFKTNMFLVVLLGYLVLDEENPGRKVAGSLLILAGTALAVVPSV